MQNVEKISNCTFRGHFGLLLLAMQRSGCALTRSSLRGYMCRAGSCLHYASKNTKKSKSCAAPLLELGEGALESLALEYD